MRQPKLINMFHEMEIIVLIIYLTEKQFIIKEKKEKKNIVLIEKYLIN